MSGPTEVRTLLSRRLAALEAPLAARDGFESSEGLLAGLAPRAGAPLEWADRRPLESLLRRFELDADLKAEYRRGWKKTEGTAPLSPSWREVLLVVLLSQAAHPESPRAWALKCLNSAFRIMDRWTSDWGPQAREILDVWVRGTPE